MNILWYIPGTVLLAGIEKLRLIFALKQSKKSIDHGVSTILAGILASILFFISWRYNLWWKDIIKYIVYGIACLGIRLAIYDPILNLFRGRQIDYENPKGTSEVDILESRLKLNFLEQRGLGLLIAVIFISLTFFLNKIW